MLQPKSWIIQKNLSAEKKHALTTTLDSWKIERETEKAYLFSIATDFGKITMWCPKSQTTEEEEYLPTPEEYYGIFSEEEIEADKKRLEEEERMMKEANVSKELEISAYLWLEKHGNLDEWKKNIDKGLDYNMQLRELLNANGVKVSMKRKLTTAYLIKKLNENGIEVPAK